MGCGGRCVCGNHHSRRRLPCRHMFTIMAPSGSERMLPPPAAAIAARSAKRNTRHQRASVQLSTRCLSGVRRGTANCRELIQVCAAQHAKGYATAEN